MATQNMPGILSTASGKAYQTIISRIDGLRVAEPEYRDAQFELVAKGIGGFIVFGGVRKEIAVFIAEAQSRADIHLFIASDIERGVGQQIEGMTPFPCQMAMAAAIKRSDKADINLLLEALLSVAAETKETGINMALTPVLDINRNPDNPIICTRAFSDDPETAAWFGTQYINILEGQGIISCAKHFPGHGDTATDSHIALPVIRKTAEQLKALDLVPFREAILSGVSSIMMGHLSIPALDVRPASLSHKIINGLLRQEMGFNGLVLTDALNMHALEEYGDAGLECLKAGADILLHPEDADKTASSLLLALEDNRLEPDILDKAVKRILDNKSRFGDRIAVSKSPGDYQLLSQRLSQKSITLLKDPSGILPLRDGEASFIMSGDTKYFTNSIFNTAINTDASGTIVVVVFTSVAAWHGTSGISDNERDRLRALIGRSRRSVVISFGSPYVLRYFDDADVLVAAYEPSIQAQQAALNCLYGKAPFTGKLPVNLSGRYQH